MDASSSHSTCARCGNTVPASAAFCPACGNPTGAATALPAPDPTLLPTGYAGTPDATLPTPRASMADAQTISPTGIQTSLDSPSPRPVGGAGPFVAGQQIGPRYTILKLLGQGGMGAVYQAFDHELGVAVAIKVIRPAAQSDATAAKELEQRFKRELVLARQVTHKYVVRIHDLGEIDGIKYLTMPFVEGETLAQVLRKSNTLPLDRVIKISQQIAEGLAAAHEKGVIHRDLKPENIMIESPSPVASAGRAADAAGPGDALIMDFGIARSVEHGATQTAAGSVIGTLEYMAPEQAQGKKVDQRADQYAFGLIMYDMLVGRARRATHDNPMTELLARLSAAPPAPRTINPAIPDTVNDIVVKLLDPDPARRYESTQALCAALNRLAPDGSIRSDVHEVIVHDAPARSKLAMAAALIILVGGAGGWLISRGMITAPVSAAHDPVSVLIGDFENKTGDPVFDGVVEQALSLGIEGASFINAFPRRDALRAAEAIKPGAKLNEETARLVAFRESLGLAMIGSIEPKGSGYHITIKGVGPGADGDVKYTLEDDAPSKADVLQTVAALAGQVRKALGDTVAPADSDAFTAANLDAVRAYARGQELFANAKYEEAIAAYLEAVKLDPDFGRGYSSAATAANNLGLRDEAAKYYDLALAKIDRMTDREKFRTRGQYYLFSRNAPKAIEELTALVDRYPSDSAGLANLAFAHGLLRQFDQAVAIGARAAALAPKNALRQNNVALYSMYAGKFDDAVRLGRVASELNRNYATAWVSQALASEALGRYDDATAAYAQLASISGWQARAALGVADMAMLRGRVAEAAAALEPMLPQKLPPQQMARVRDTLAAIRLAQGRTADAIKLAEEALQASSDSVVRYEAGRIFAAASRLPRAKELATELEKSLVPDTQTLGMLLRGEIQIIDNDIRGAVATLQASTRIADTWMAHYLLGRAYLQAGEFTDADREFDICERRKGEATAVHIDDVPTWRLIAPVHYYTGVTRAALKRATAADALRAFVELKRGGDEKSALVADAEKRLAQ
jgi:tetratricopeptide (TPR) repeat protein/tRNA A-37 threonylcarbamoyl transferase component Bud32